jgi:hypothetical protein
LPLEVEDDFEEAQKKQKIHATESKARHRFAHLLLKHLEKELNAQLTYHIIHYSNHVDEYQIYFRNTKFLSVLRRKRPIMQVIDCRENNAKAKKYQFVIIALGPKNRDPAEKLAAHLALIHEGERMKLKVTAKPIKPRNLNFFS